MFKLVLLLGLLSSFHSLLESHKNSLKSYQNSLEVEKEENLESLLPEINKKTSQEIEKNPQLKKPEKELSQLINPENSPELIQNNFENISTTRPLRKAFRREAPKIRSYEDFSININELFIRFINPNCDQKCRESLFEAIKPLRSLSEISDDMRDVIIIKRPFFKDYIPDNQNLENFPFEINVTEEQARLGEYKREIDDLEMIEYLNKNKDKYMTEAQVNKEENLNWPKEPEKHAPSIFGEKISNGINGEDDFYSDGRAIEMRLNRIREEKSHRLLLAFEKEGKENNLEKNFLKEFENLIDDKNNLKDISRLTGVPLDELKIVNYRREEINENYWESSKNGFKIEIDGSFISQNEIKNKNDHALKTLEDIKLSEIKDTHAQIFSDGQKSQIENSLE